MLMWALLSPRHARWPGLLGCPSPARHARVPRTLEHTQRRTLLCRSEVRVGENPAGILNASPGRVGSIITCRYNERAVDCARLRTGRAFSNKTGPCVSVARVAFPSPLSSPRSSLPLLLSPPPSPPPLLFPLPSSPSPSHPPRLPLPHLCGGDLKSRWHKTSV